MLLTGYFVVFAILQNGGGLLAILENAALDFDDRKGQSEVSPQTQTKQIQNAMKADHAQRKYDAHTLKLNYNESQANNNKPVRIRQSGKNAKNRRAHRTQDGWPEVLRAVAASGREIQNVPKCVPIPSNFSLCYGIQYTSMRLPNLLEHETLEEAIEQSKAWNSLLQLHCHPDTKLYLCSLFAPICLPNLNKPLFPCQSMCLSVQQGCESRMAQYGFPWPEMLRCRFPADNDMCIKPAAGQPPSQHNKELICKSCAQVSTFENLMDNYCRSKLVWKIRIKGTNGTHINVSRMRAFKNASVAGDSRAKPHETKKQFAHHALSIFRMEEDGCSCPILRENAKLSGNYLLMAMDAKSLTKRNNNAAQHTPTATLLVPWRKNDNNFKRAIRRFRKVDCSTLGREIRESVLRQNHRPGAAYTQRN